MRKIIPKNRPVEIRMIINALSGDTRLRILKVLLQHPEGLTASEISSKINLTLPTTLTHLNQLISAGLIKWIYAKRGKRLLKLYKVTSKEIVLNVDLEILSNSPSLEKLENLLWQLVQKYRQQGVLPPMPSIEDIEKLLKIEKNEAIALIDYFKVSEERIVEKLSTELEEKMRDKEEISLKDISEKLRVHDYWAIQVARKLEEKGNYILEKGFLRKILRWYSEFQK